MSDGTEDWFEPRRIGTYTIRCVTPAQFAYHDMWEALVELGGLADDDPTIPGAVSDARLLVALFVHALMEEVGADEPR